MLIFSTDRRHTACIRPGAAYTEFSEYTELGWGMGAHIQNLDGLKDGGLHEGILRYRTLDLNGNK